jgi:hypothetical protein
MDVYSFLSSPASPNNLTETISTLVNKSRADIENNGILNQEYAAQIVCILSQYVDRYICLYLLKFFLFCDSLNLLNFIGYLKMPH